MCAKKTPTTPTKQNVLTGSAKSPLKKATAPKQTTKAKADDSVLKSNITSAILKDSDAKKLETKSTATSNKKAKTIVNETKASNPTTPIKGNIKQTQIAAKKITISRDSSADNSKGKKQPINGKSNKAKAVDSDRDKSGENKSNQIRDNKITVKSDEVKSKCSSSNEQCNKIEKSSSSLSLKSSGESDNVIKEKLCKKGSDKPKLNASPSSTPKKINNRNNDEGSKKSADKSKPSKNVKKVNKQKESSKIKISNELKNLGIEMSKSNSSLAVVIQEGLTSGVKTSICEMVKTKARICSNLNSGVKNQSVQAKRCCSEVKTQINKTNKESQEKVLKDDEAKVNESVEGKKANSEQFKLIEMPINDDKKIIIQDPSKSIITNEPVVVKSKNKISALVNAKNSNKNKLLNELKKCENVNKSNELEPSKPVKRKYVKKKKEDAAADSLKNSVSASESDARNNEKIDQNKSNCVNISDGTGNIEIKSASNPDVNSKDEITVGGRKENSSTSESTAKSTQNKPKLVPKVKNQLQEGSKAKKTVLSLCADGEFDGLKVGTPTVAEKIKRKYVRKAKPTQNETAEKLDSEKTSLIKGESEKSTDISESNKESHKNGQLEKKPKNSTVVNDEAVKKPLESVLCAPKKDLIETQDKVAKNKVLKGKTADKKPIEKAAKLSPKKQKIEIKQEENPVESSSSESENSSNSSDSDSELTEDTFKKPNKPSIQRNLRNKKQKQKQIACKRTRVASLNATAKVHCMYENEARSVYEANIAKAIKQSCGIESSDEDEEASKKVDLASMR